jgi:hypothetical protein
LRWLYASALTPRHRIAVERRRERRRHIHVPRTGVEADLELNRIASMDPGPLACATTTAGCSPRAARFRPTRRSAWISPFQVAGLGGLIVTRSARGRGLTRLLAGRLLKVAGEFGSHRAMLIPGRS